MILQVLTLMLPLIIAGILHMVCVSKNLFSSLAIPIHASVFGANKTIRGFILMSFFGMFGVYIQKIVSTEQMINSLYQSTPNWLLLGISLGFTYTLFELPNSYLKRKMGIAPGEQSPSHQLTFFILDRIDSATGIAIIYYFFGVSFKLVLLCIILNLVVHPLITIPLYLLGIKKKLL